jgi:hypothetical protein
MNPDQMTTIKVPTRVRDRLRERAEQEGVTQGEALEHLLDQAPHPQTAAWIADLSERWKPLLDRLA